MENLNNYINESLSKETIKQLKDIFSKLTKVATDENWDVLLKREISNINSQSLTKIKEHFDNIDLPEIYFDLFKKCLKKANDLNNSELIRSVFVKYISNKDNMLDWDDLVKNDKSSEGNIYSDIRNINMNFSLPFLQSIYNITAQHKTLGVGKGEVLLMLFLKDAKKGSDVKIGDKIQIEVKGENARIPTDQDWYTDIKNYFNITAGDKSFTGISFFKNWYENNKKKFENWCNELGININNVNDAWKLLAAVSLQRYQITQGWNYFYIMNSHGKYKILNANLALSIQDYYDFLKNIKLGYGLSSASSFNGFGFTLL